MTCQCGMPYENTSDGRWAHKIVQGHAVSPVREEAPA